MRVIEKQIINSVRENKYLKTARDEIIRNSDGTMSVYLWGHKIACIDQKRKYLHVSTCGYATQTTNRRINAIFAALNLPYSLCTRDGSSVFSTGDAGDWTVQCDTGDWIVEHR